MRRAWSLLGLETVMGWGHDEPSTGYIAREVGVREETQMNTGRCEWLLPTQSKSKQELVPQVPLCL